MCRGLKTLFSGPDFYHTCYGLSGLSLAQHRVTVDPSSHSSPQPHKGIGVDLVENATCVGQKNNILKPTHPVYNLSMPCAISALTHFYALDRIA